MKKRWIGAAALLLMMFLFFLPAYAVDDAVRATPANASPVEWNDILKQAILGIVGGAATLLTSIVAFICKRYVVPWLKEKRLFGLAKALVAAAEAELGRHTGALKWEQVAEWLAIKGLSIDAADVRQAVKAAWLELNNTMIGLGLKDPEKTT